MLYSYKLVLVNYMLDNKGEIFMNLSGATLGKEYIIQDILTDDEELNSFLFSLGCYSGEPITVVSQMRGGFVIAVKDGRYNIDQNLAQAIVIQD